MKGSIFLSSEVLLEFEFGSFFLANRWNYESKIFATKTITSRSSIVTLYMDNQKQSPSVTRNRCSENMQHVYRRTPMPKCDFNREIALRHGCSPENFLFSEGMQAIYRRKPMPKSHFFIEITFWHGCSPVNLLYIFGTPFPKKTFGKLLLDNFAEAACGFNTDFSNSSLWTLTMTMNRTRSIHQNLITSSLL